MSLKVSLIVLVLISNFWSPLFAIQKEKNISYTNKENGQRNLLDIYYPKKNNSPKNVLVFIHGGSWKKGKKDTYWWLGRNLANKDVVTVTINYRLSPLYQYEEMASDCAAALKWVKNNISQYGGNPDRIFIMGHSAGGHLAALIDTDPRFFKQQGIENPIKGVILNDAFGLDMHQYLGSAEQDEGTASFLRTFSNDKENWKIASPITYFKNIRNPYLILVGEKTYPSIQIQSHTLYEHLKSNEKSVDYHIINNKKHIGMIGQMIFKRNQLYNYIVDFLKRPNLLS